MLFYYAKNANTCAQTANVTQHAIPRKNSATVIVARNTAIATKIAKKLVSLSTIIVPPSIILGSQQFQALLKYLAYLIVRDY